MKKPSPTLIDDIYRMTFRNDPVLHIIDNYELRKVLTSARKFVLDDGMSSFLGDLATAAFVDGRSAKMKPVLVDQLRISARSPHRVVWIEYNLRNALRRTNELLKRPHRDDECPYREGWLIEQHPQLPTAFRLHLFTANPPEEHDSHGFHIWGFPVVYSWTVDDSPSPWRSILGEGGTSDSELATGIIGYDTKGGVTITTSELIDDARAYENKKAVVNLIREWVGTLRRVWALLATINDLPVLKTEVKQSRGFVAKGRYRRFLDHSTITLHVPQKVSLRKLARQMIAIARRRAHQVRGHFRKDWRNPGALLCTHEWGTDNICRLCHGHRLWITEHQRGDASLGFVTHDYEVTHGGGEKAEGQGALPDGLRGEAVR